MTDSNEDTSDGTSAFEDASEERAAMVPDEGFAIVEIDMMKPPGEALTKLGHELVLADISLPPASELIDYVVYDADGYAYDHDDLRDRSPTDPDRIDSLREELSDGAIHTRRLALLELAQWADDDPEVVAEAIPTLTTLLSASEPDIRAGAVVVCRAIAEGAPEQTEPVVDDIVAFIDPQTRPRLLEEAVEFVAAVADDDPSAVLDAVPKLAAVLTDDTDTEEPAIRALQRIATEHPTAVVPIAPRLREYLDEGSSEHRVGAIGVLGMIAKDHPDVAEQTIPTAMGLLDADYYKVRANAAGLLADLADQYPTQVRSVVPQAIELLDDTDENARYNATSILARVAKTHPEAVAPAIDPLIEVLDNEHAATRANACWALGYVKADQAVPALVDQKEAATDEDVLDAAVWAIDTIMKNE